MRFSFIGEVDYNSLDSKVPYYRVIDGKAKGHSLSLTSIEAKNNRAFVEMAGFKNDPIKTTNTDNEAIEIAWDDRLDEDSVKKVASYRKHVITLNEQRHKFISEYDFISFVKDHVDDIKGKRYQITGQVAKNEYKGKISDRFRIGSMYEITDDNKKNAFLITGDFFFNKDSIDLADWAKEKKIYLNGWTEEYIDKEHPNVMIARQLVFDCSKINFEEERHVQILSYRLKQIGLALDDDHKVVSKLKKNKYYKIAVVCRYVNGTETADFTEKDLNENQREAISLGIASLEDFRPAGAIYGDRVTILKLKDFDLRGDYANGSVEAEFDEDNIYTPTENESVDKAFAEDAMNAPEEEDDGDLFD